jgi:hypothetical protein
MTRLLCCVLACSLLHSAALRASHGGAEDQPPQLYPAVTVHVPEPVGNAPAARAAIDALSEEVTGLNAVEQRVHAQEQAVLAAFGQLGQQIQSLTDTLGTMAL